MAIAKKANLSRMRKKERQKKREKREAAQDRLRKLLLKNKQEGLPGTNLMEHGLSR